MKKKINLLIEESLLKRLIVEAKKKELTLDELVEVKLQRN